MPETDEALDIRDPGLTDVLGDDDALSLWEMMRRASAATEAETLAKASGLSLEWVHDCLDRLVEADLVEMMRATSRRPTTRWRVRRETIIVGYRVNDPLDEVLIQCVDELFGPRRRKQIEAHVRRGTARRGPHERWRRSWAGDLDVAEIRRFWDLMQELARLYHAAGSRFVGSPPSQEQMCTHHLEFVVQPLRPGVSPLPEIRMKAIGPGASPESASWVLGMPEPTRSELDSGTPSGSATLTRREREVATLLVEDCSRAEVAERLGISTNTVISHIRNIYRKLGVRSRIGLRRCLA